MNTQYPLLPAALIFNPASGAADDGRKFHATLQELLAHSRGNPGKLTFSTVGQGASSHLVGEMFKAAAGIDMVHVPFKGGGPSIAALVANEIQVLFDTVSGSKALAESGKLRALAVTSPERSPAMPSVPTVSESGLGDFSIVYWLAIFAPAKTPQPLVDRLYGEFRTTLAKPEIAARLLETGTVVQALPPAEFGKVLANDIQRWKVVIENAKIDVQ